LKGAIAVKGFTAQHDDIEANLIQQAQRGDRNAFAELVYRHREGVVMMVYRMVGDAHLAEDVAQDTFIRAWNGLPRYKPVSPFRNWLLRIASNRTMDLLRKERETYDIEDLSIPSAANGPEAEALGSERASQVQLAIMKLPAASRVVLILREYQELSYQEIAALLNIPKGTVMSRLNYARKKLQQALLVYLEAS
jgi:RNA polymerase sigma-70 factor (ECF subfamily)